MQSEEDDHHADQQHGEDRARHGQEQDWAEQHTRLARVESEGGVERQRRQEAEEQQAGSRFGRVASWGSSTTRPPITSATAYGTSNRLASMATRAAPSSNRASWRASCSGTGSAGRHPPLRGYRADPGEDSSGTQFRDIGAGVRVSAAGAAGVEGAGCWSEAQTLPFGMHPPAAARAGGQSAA
jgi:hypothetical protein